MFPNGNEMIIIIIQAVITWGGGQHMEGFHIDNVSSCQCSNHHSATKFVHIIGF